MTTTQAATMNGLAHTMFEAAVKRVSASQAANKGPAEETLWAEYEQAAKMLGLTIDDAVRGAVVGDVIHTHDHMLTVCTVLAQTNGSVLVQATADGLGYESAWHSGPEAEWVGFTSWFIGSLGVTRNGHGYIDSVSRRIVQTG